MTVAIVHYHLELGGVSQVISAASSALTDAGIPHVILVGSAPDDLSTILPVRVVSELGYARSSDDCTAEEILTKLRHHAREALGTSPEIWHFHNHSLGKNPHFPHLVTQLAAAHERVILQIHDLAESGRSGNYPLIAACEELYPFSSRIHYAFLNPSDLATFIRVGLPPENASVLHNPVIPNSTVAHSSTDSPTDSPSAAIVLAPVRGIRRKNLGELVFLSALAPSGTGFAVSRAPLNPEARPIHDTWRKFANRQRLPIEFDVVGRFSPAAGATPDFDAWTTHATHFITTSVAEGFGLPFLEAIAHGKPLLGRNLPHLTAEHSRHGIQTGHLYDRLLIPVDWIDLTILNDHLTTDLERTYRSYQRPLSNEFIDTLLTKLSKDGWLDFGNLPEAIQQGIIERFTSDPANRMIPQVEINGKTQPAAEWISTVLLDRTPTATPEQLAPYSSSTYQNTLIALYQTVANSPVSALAHVPPHKILTSQLTAEKFHFLLAALKPPAPQPKACRAVIFDIYGTLLDAPQGGVQPDPLSDPILREILRNAGHSPSASPSSELHAAVLRHHRAAEVTFPEIDLRVLWRELLELPSGTDITGLVRELEQAWHPARPIPGAEQPIQALARSGISLGLLSNAQCNTLIDLGDVSFLFAPELTVLSYQHGIAKPAPELFQILTDRLAGRGITPEETLFVGNDPLQDILPAAAAGFQTALFAGHPDSLREGDCSPDLTFVRWAELTSRVIEK
jgi:FMN phosphatase YigB (HAD superfamily)